MSVKAWKFVSSARTHWVGLALSFIILVSATAAVRWVFIVPIFQSPDEPTHFDYALNIYSADRLISGREPLHDWNDPNTCFHVYTQYLLTSTDFQRILFKPWEKVRRGYGTRQFYDRLAANAPAEDSGTKTQKPRFALTLATIYPYGYYAALAVWMKLVRPFSKSLVVLFFWARLFSVFLLIISLLLTYVTARELRLTPSRALLVTAAVGLLPLTTFVASYIQADNLTLMMVMLCCYLALVARRKPTSLGLLILLGLSLGGLCITKYHYYVAVLPAVLGMLIADKLAGRRKTGWARLVTVALAPSVILALGQVWIQWHSNRNVILSNPSTGHALLSEAASQGSGSVIRFLLGGIPHAFSNFYLDGSAFLDGSTFHSFWAVYGWMDAGLVMVNGSVTRHMLTAIAVLNVIIFGLTVLRICGTTYRLIKLARRGRGRKALSIAFSNPLLNSYFIFTLIMFGLLDMVRLSFSPQGRNWFGFVPAIILVGTWYAPKALPRRLSPRTFSNVTMAALLVYCVMGVHYAKVSMKQRFYSLDRSPAVIRKASGSAVASALESPLKQDTMLTRSRTTPKGEANMSENTRKDHALPPDDPRRELSLAQPDHLPHLGLVGDTYTVTITGEDTGQRFCVIDMYVPPGGGPPPHRHDFEETFIILEGEMEATFRGKKSTISAGETLNIPANAPHQFHNVSSEPVRMLCICSPAGQEKFFMEVGVPVPTRTTVPPKLNETEQALFIEKVKALAPKYRTELLKDA